jgi:MFS family permease
MRQRRRTGAAFNGKEPQCIPARGANEPDGIFHCRWPLPAVLWAAERYCRSEKTDLCRPDHLRTWEHWLRCCSQLHVLIGFRALQGFGACAGMTIPRAIVRDIRTGHEATRIMSLLMLIVSTSPIVAPLTGSFIIGVFGWRAVFGALTGAAIIGMLLATTQLTEARPAGHRSDSTWRSAFSAYRLLLVDPMFIGLSLSARSAFRPSLSTSETHLSFSSITMHSRRRFSASALLLMPIPFLPSAR